MKKFSFIAFIAVGLFLSACNSNQQTVGSHADSGSVGNSGPADTAQAASSTTGATASGTATSSSDTSTIKH